MNKIHLPIFGLALLVITIFNGCKKAIVNTDERDAIVGNYSCIDSMFEVSSIEEIDGYIKVNYSLKSILFHPLIIVSKGTFFTFNKEWVDGVMFKNIQKDTVSNNYSEMGMVKDKVFQTFNHSGSFYMEDLSSPAERTATIQNNEISVVYKTLFTRQYSRSRLKRIK